MACHCQFAERGKTGDDTHLPTGDRLRSGMSIPTAGAAQEKIKSYTLDLKVRGLRASRLVGDELLTRFSPVIARRGWPSHYSSLEQPSRNLSLGMMLSHGIDFRTTSQRGGELVYGCDLAVQLAACVSLGVADCVWFSRERSRPGSMCGDRIESGESGGMCGPRNANDHGDNH